MNLYNFVENDGVNQWDYLGLSSDCCKILFGIWMNAITAFVNSGIHYENAVNVYKQAATALYDSKTQLKSAEGAVSAARYTFKAAESNVQSTNVPPGADPFSYPRAFADQDAAWKALDAARLELQSSTSERDRLKTIVATKEPLVFSASATMIKAARQMQSAEATMKSQQQAYTECLKNKS